MLEGGALSVEKWFYPKVDTWQEKCLKNLDILLLVKPAKHQTIFLSNYYLDEHNLEPGSMQQSLFDAVIKLDRNFSERLSKMPREKRLSFHELTIKPFNDEFDKLMTQLKHKKLLTSAKPLTPDAIERHLKRLKIFIKAVSGLPNIYEDNYFWALLQRFVNRIASLYTPVTHSYKDNTRRTVNDFVKTNQQVIGYVR